MSKTKLTRKQIEEIVRQKVLQALNEEETIEVAGEEIDAGQVTDDAENADQLAKSFVTERAAESMDPGREMSAAEENYRSTLSADSSEQLGVQPPSDASGAQGPGASQAEGGGSDNEQGAAQASQESVQENLTDKEWYDKSLYERLTRKWSK
ncbi:MAG TPA: hypothetical protein DEQ32_14735 [Gammaproteobacteria bacterium]|nr:hypothetical protein [Gammaproteobacteria bacterium]